MRISPLVLVLASCGPTTPDVPGVAFEMFAGAQYDMQPFNEAWTAARADPARGVTYTFPLVTTGLADGTTVRLVAGRSGNDPQPPSTTGDDVIIADELWLATARVTDDTAGFPPLGVTTGAWGSDRAEIPADLLCGTTVIAVRAYEAGTADLPAYRLLAATWMIAVTTPCE